MENINVMLVEDEAIIALATKHNLEKFGYNVKIAYSGNNVVDIIKSNEPVRIDIVLMDIDLGTGMNGVETAKKILDIIDIPIIFVSSHTETNIISSAKTVAGYGYIVKSSAPIVYDTVIAMAIKLFTEKTKSDIYSCFVTTAIQRSSEPFFICNSSGDIEFFNNEYLKIQGLSDPGKVERKFEKYKEQIIVFSEDGEMLSSDDIASMRPLKRMEGTNVVFYVYNKQIKKLLGNLYTYAPVFYKNKIVGSYVKIGEEVKLKDLEVKKKIENKIHLTINLS